MHVCPQFIILPLKGEKNWAQSKGIMRTSTSLHTHQFCQRLWPYGKIINHHNTPKRRSLWSITPDDMINDHSHTHTNTGANGLKSCGDMIIIPTNTNAQHARSDAASRDGEVGVGHHTHIYSYTQPHTLTATHNRIHSQLHRHKYTTRTKWCGEQRWRGARRPPPHTGSCRPAPT